MDLPGHFLARKDTDSHGAVGTPTQEDTNPQGVSAHLHKPEIPVPASTLTTLHPYFFFFYFTLQLSCKLHFPLVCGRL